MAGLPVVNQGETKFVVEYLAEHGDAKRAAINQAWRAAGHEGEISESLVAKLRAKHGLSGGRKAAEEPAEETAAGQEDASEMSSRNEKPETTSKEEKPEVALSTRPGFAYNSPVIRIQLDKTTRDGLQAMKA